MKISIMLLVVPFLLTAACERSRHPVRAAKQAARDKDLQGKTFQAECDLKLADALASGIATGLEASVKSARVQYKFTGDEFTRRTVYYVTTNCADEAFALDEIGTMDIKGKSDRSNDGGRNVNLKYKKAKVEILSDAGAKVANALNLCGRNNWASGQDQDVTQRARELTCFNAKYPREDHTIYRVDNGNTLILGPYTREDRADQDRPATLDFSVTYKAK